MKKRREMKELTREERAAIIEKARRIAVKALGRRPTGRARIRAEYLDRSLGYEVEFYGEIIVEEVSIKAKEK